MLDIPTRAIGPIFNLKSHYNYYNSGPKHVKYVKQVALGSRKRFVVSVDK